MMNALYLLSSQTYEKRSMFLRNSSSLNWQWIILLEIKCNCFNISKKKINLNAQLNTFGAPSLQSSQVMHLRELLLAPAGETDQGNAEWRCSVTVISKTGVIWQRKKNLTKSQFSATDFESLFAHKLEENNSCIRNWWRWNNVSQILTYLKLFSLIQSR